MPEGKRIRRAVVDQGKCVACGCCVKVCPRSAVQIWRGISARVDEALCIGCGKCARECPATVIAMTEAEG